MSILSDPAIFDAICFMREEHRMLRCTGHKLVREFFLGGDTRTSNPEPGKTPRILKTAFFFVGGATQVEQESRRRNVFFFFVLEILASAPFGIMADTPSRDTSQNRPPGS